MSFQLHIVPSQGTIPGKIYVRNAGEVSCPKVTMDIYCEQKGHFGPITFHADPDWQGRLPGQEVCYSTERPVF